MPVAERARMLSRLAHQRRDHRSADGRPRRPPRRMGIGLGKRWPPV